MLQRNATFTTVVMKVHHVKKTLNVELRITREHVNVFMATRILMDVVKRVCDRISLAMVLGVREKSYDAFILVKVLGLKRPDLCYVLNNKHRLFLLIYLIILLVYKKRTHWLIWLVLYRLTQNTHSPNSVRVDTFFFQYHLKNITNSPFDFKPNYDLYFYLC